RYLLAVLAIVGLTTVATFGVTSFVTTTLDEQQDTLARQIIALRTATGARPLEATTVEVALSRRKHDAPSIVIALESLSRVLPDHTYLTELRVDGDRLRIIGLTSDAPSLIGLIEQTGIFTRATFFAPTTKSPSDPGERFHIEAVIQPLVSPRS